MRPTSGRRLVVPSVAVRFCPPIADLARRRTKPPGLVESGHPQGSTNRFLDELKRELKA
jgi:hypothetical protein